MINFKQKEGILCYKSLHFNQEILFFAKKQVKD